MPSALEAARIARLSACAYLFGAIESIMSMTAPRLQNMANAIRVLSMDAVLARS